MTNYTRHRTASPALVRFLRSDAISDAGFFVMIFTAGVAVDGLLWILANVVQKFAN